MKLNSCLYLALCALLYGCATNPDPRHAERARQELLATDSAFSAMSEARGAAEAFYQYMAENGTSLPAGEQPIHGRAAIRDSLLEAKGLLKWQPVGADLASSGDLGYTWGRFDYRSEAPGREQKHSYGKYVTVWKKQANGNWKAVLDCGNSNPAPPP